MRKSGHGEDIDRRRRRVRDTRCASRGASFKLRSIPSRRGVRQCKRMRSRGTRGQYARDAVCDRRGKQRCDKRRVRTDVGVGSALGLAVRCSPPLRRVIRGKAARGRRKAEVQDSEGGRQVSLGGILDLVREHNLTRIRKGDGKALQLRVYRGRRRFDIRSNEILGRQA